MGIDPGGGGGLGLHRALGRLQLTATGPERFLVGGKSEIAVEIDPPGALIGRDEDADVVISDEGVRVSRRHCVVEATGAGWVIRDWGSKHGTALRVRGEGRMPLPQHLPWVLRSGMSVILAGVVELKVTILGASPRGKETAAAGASPLAPPLLSDAELRLAIAFTKPFRELPPRHDHAPIEELMEELGYSRRSIYVKLGKLAELPAVRAKIGGQSEERRRMRELAAALTQLYPGLADPSTDTG